MPPEVAEDEKLVRAIKVPYHYDVRKGRLKPAAFRPPRGTSLVSVIRLLMGADFCKNKSVEIAGSEYLGLGVLVAAEARAAGAAVDDAVEDFIGHAHIDVGIVLLPDEPLSPQINERLQSRLLALCRCTRFELDPAPQSPGWSGPEL